MANFEAAASASGADLMRGVGAGLLDPAAGYGGGGVFRLIFRPLSAPLAPMTNLCRTSGEPGSELGGVGGPKKPLDPPAVLLYVGRLPGAEHS